jgi:hypothetical protein
MQRSHGILKELIYDCLERMARRAASCKAGHARCGLPAPPMDEGWLDARGGARTESTAASSGRTTWISSVGYQGRRRSGGMAKRGLVAFSIHPLPQKFAVATHGLGFFPGLAFGWLLIGTAQLHFAEDAFTLHLLLERFQRLIDIVVAYNYVNDGRHSLVDMRRSNMS